MSQDRDLNATRVQQYLDALKTGAATRPDAAAVEFSALELGFIESAKEYADSKNMPTSAFSEMGVPDRIMAAAGLATAAEIEADFVEAAKRFADEKGLTYADFLKAGVAPEVLKAAGFDPETN